MSVTTRSTLAAAALLMYERVRMLWIRDPSHALQP